MKKNRDRKDFIKDFILGELRKNGFSVSDIARKTGRAKSTVHCCIHGLSSSAIIQKTIIEMKKWKVLIGFGGFLCMG